MPKKAPPARRIKRNTEHSRFVMDHLHDEWIWGDVPPHNGEGKLYSNEKLEIRNQKWWRRLRRKYKQYLRVACQSQIISDRALLISGETLPASSHSSLLFSSFFPPAKIPASCSLLTRISLGFAPSAGPTMPRRSMVSMRRPARV